MIILLSIRSRRHYQILRALAAKVLGSALG